MVQTWGDEVCPRVCTWRERMAPPLNSWTSSVRPRRKREESLARAAGCIATVASPAYCATIDGGRINVARNSFIYHAKGWAETCREESHTKTLVEMDLVRAHV